MNNIIIILLFIVLGAFGFVLVRSRAVRLASVSGNSLASLPGYYGWCAVLWSVIPAILIYICLLWVGVLTPWVAIVICPMFLAMTYFTLSPEFRARQHVEKIVRFMLLGCAFISIAITALIVLSVLFESLRFFDKVPVTDFLFGTHWSPQTALRADQSGSSGSFGALPLFLGTFLITFIAMLIAGPLGLFSAIYIAEYARPEVRNFVKPVLEVLAGIPTVVYGYFAAITFAPALRDFGEIIGLSISSESALVAGVVMGIMIIPFVLSLSDDVINAVPNALREASLGLGATRSETIRKVVIPAALPGIMGAMLLAISRGIGETMIVVMAAGLSANMTANPLESVTTVTAQIVTLLVGDQEFDSTKTLAAFALGITLFIFTLLLNIMGMVITRKYQERYE